MDNKLTIRTSLRGSGFDVLDLGGGYKVLMVMLFPIVIFLAKLDLLLVGKLYRTSIHPMDAMASRFCLPVVLFVHLTFHVLRQPSDFLSWLPESATRYFSILSASLIMLYCNVCTITTAPRINDV